MMLTLPPLEIEVSPNREGNIPFQVIQQEIMTNLETRGLDATTLSQIAFVGSGGSALNPDELVSVNDYPDTGVQDPISIVPRDLINSCTTFPYEPQKVVNGQVTGRPAQAIDQALLDFVNADFVNELQNTDRPSFRH
jgi:hypothetical protein